MKCWVVGSQRAWLEASVLRHGDVGGGRVWWHITFHARRLATCNMQCQCYAWNMELNAMRCDACASYATRAFFFCPP